MQIDIENIQWKITYSRYFFSRDLSSFASPWRYVGYLVWSSLLLILFVVGLALFIIAGFGLLPFYIIQQFEGVAAPWAAEPIIHGLRFYLMVYTVVFVPLILFASLSKAEGTRRFLRDALFMTCSVTVPLTMLEITRTYPTEWTGGIISPMTAFDWIHYFSIEMLDAILFGHLTHFYDMTVFPRPNTFYTLVLVFLMKIYFTVSFAWYFLFVLKVKLTGSITITCSAEDLHQWLPLWINGKRVIDPATITIQAVGVETNIRKVAKAQTYEAMFAEPLVKQKSTAKDQKLRHKLHHQAIYEMPPLFMASMMNGGALLLASYPSRLSAKRGSISY